MITELFKGLMYGFKIILKPLFWGASILSEKTQRVKYYINKERNSLRIKKRTLFKLNKTSSKNNEIF